MGYRSLGWAVDTSGVSGDDIDDIPAFLYFNAGSSTYCGAAGFRDTLTSSHGWIVEDGGSACGGYGTVWTGASDSNWFDGGNWSNGVPISTIRAFIPGSVNNIPLINGPGAAAGFLQLLPGAELQVADTGELRIGAE